jgi:hypothetical protein
LCRHWRVNRGSFSLCYAKVWSLMHFRYHLQIMVVSEELQAAGWLFS